MIGAEKEDKHYRIKPGFILRQIAGEYAIVPVDAESLVGNAVMAPNDPAAFLWKAFRQPCTAAEAVAKAMAEYDGTKEQIENDVDRFINDSLTLHIMEEVD